MDTKENQTYNASGYGSTHAVQSDTGYTTFRLVIQARNGTGWMSVANWAIFGKEVMTPTQPVDQEQVNLAGQQVTDEDVDLVISGYAI